MHLLIPYAQCCAPAAREAFEALTLPQLRRLRARLTPTHLDSAGADTLSPPHERALARALGLGGADGRIPWAAWQRRHAAVPAGTAWACISPCHWHAHGGQVVMRHPPALQLDAQDSQALQQAMAGYFAEDGLTLHYHAPELWLAEGAVLADLPCASLDRVIGRSIERWTLDSPGARLVRRLQNEMQMLLYTHPVNDARAARGLPTVNSFWVHGAGALPTPAPQPQDEPRVPQGLREAALREDWAAWAEAWRQIDAQDCAALAEALDAGQGVTLTLCGERGALQLQPRPGGLWQEFLGLFGRKSASSGWDML